MSKRKITKKKSTTNSKTKTHKISDTRSDPKEFIKKYPGFVIAIIFSLIVIALLFTPTMSADPELEEKLYYAQQIHIENILFVEDTLLTVEAELDGEYEDTLEDDYLISIMGDLEWFSGIENAIYNSKPTSDVFVKEIAVVVFRNRMVEINEQFTFDIIDFNPEYTIQLALEKEAVQNFITEEDIKEIFEDNNPDRKLFLDTLNKIIAEYFKEKKRLINESSSDERKFVEAKKLILLSY